MRVKNLRHLFLHFFGRGLRNAAAGNFLFVADFHAGNAVRLIIRILFKHRFKHGSLKFLGAHAAAGDINVQFAGSRIFESPDFGKGLQRFGRGLASVGLRTVQIPVINQAVNKLVFSSVLNKRGTVGKSLNPAGGIIAQLLAEFDLFRQRHIKVLIHKTKLLIIHRLPVIGIFGHLLLRRSR